MTDFSYRASTLPKAGSMKNGGMVILVAEDEGLPANAASLDEAAGGAISRAMTAADFNGRTGQSVTVTGLTDELNLVTVIGIGDREELSDLALVKAGSAAYRAMEKPTVQAFAIECGELTGAQAAQVGHGAELRSHQFTKYRTTLKDSQKISLSHCATMCSEEQVDAAKAAAQDLSAIAAGVHLTRDLINEPANILYPEELVARAKAELEPLGVEVEIFDVAQMEELGFGALLGVAMGSDRPARMAIMKWNGGKKGDAPVAFVGKGVTFDTGGISIKPAAGMEDMKWDMGGAGTVVGLMKALAGRKAKANIIAAIGCVENMPGSRAQRPGDIVKSYSGQTIEVLNTDAEGRLVLADVLWYVQEQYKPKFMVDLATLTGAMLVALGFEKAGVFSNNDALAKQITAAGDVTGDACWHMPIGPEYNKQLDADMADVKNIGGGRWGGSITAACFLQRFVNDVPWAHLDVAGVVWSDKDKGTSRKGGTGWGVRLLNEFVATNYED